MGQGLNTKVQQVVAHALGVNVSLINVTDCSSDRTPNTSPTAASVGADINCMAALDACEKIMMRLNPLKDKLKKAEPMCPWTLLIERA